MSRKSSAGPRTAPAAGAAVDRRVARTRRALHQALIAEVLAKGYDQVTVQDVIDRADVGRSTFYSHFPDKEALLASSIGELRGFLLDQRGTEPLGWSRALFAHVDDMRELGRAVFGRKSGAAMQEQMRRMITALVRDDLAALAPRGPAGPAIPLDALATYVVATFLALIGWWLDHRTGLDAAGIEAHFRALVMPGLRAGLR